MDKNNQIIIYNTEDGQTKIEVKMENETVWLSQKQMAELFDCSMDNIGLHLKNVYSERELDENRTTEESSVVQKEGNREVNRPIRLYNLDAIISVGYRINSLRGTQFRIWATQKLREYIIRVLLWMTNDWPKVGFAGLILKNGKNESERSELRKLIFIKKSEMFLPRARIIIRNWIMLNNFSPQCKINFILPLRA
ncbi:MAG: virulence RhuM family protein [Patescibacteria group bacterium]|nr:virulence RhuM family protein [Patescibacteria group bacterium]